MTLLSFISDVKELPNPPHRGKKSASLMGLKGRIGGRIWKSMLGEIGVYLKSAMSQFETP